MCWKQTGQILSNGGRMLHTPSIQICTASGAMSMGKGVIYGTSIRQKITKKALPRRNSWGQARSRHRSCGPAISWRRRGAPWTIPSCIKIIKAPSSWKSMARDRVAKEPATSTSDIFCDGLSCKQGRIYHILSNKTDVC